MIIALAKSKQNSGFTIVELLVVIVVIGVLSAIVITAYNGVQFKARNTARIQTAKNFRTALQVLDSQRVTFSDLLVDQGVGFKTACFSKGLQDMNGDGKGDCVMSGGNVVASEIPAFEAAIKTVSSIPQGKAYPEVSAGSTTSFYRSPFVYNTSVDGTDRDLIEYGLEGNTQDCVLKPIVIFISSGNYTFNNPSGQKYSSALNGATSCIVPTD